MSKKPKTISPAKHLQAFALFTMARKHMVKVEDYHEELCALLGEEKSGHIGDEIYSIGNDAGDFDGALKKIGIVVAPRKRKR